MNSLYKRIVTMGMISFTALLAWVYCILAYRDKLVYIAVISLVLVASIYAFLNAFAGLQLSKEAKLQNYINNTITSTLTKITVEDGAEGLEKLSKASYVQLRKSNTLLNKIAEDNSNNYQHSIEVNNELNAAMIKMLSDSVNKAAKVIVKYNQIENEKLLSAINDIMNIKMGITNQESDDEGTADVIQFPSAEKVVAAHNDNIDNYADLATSNIEPEFNPDKQLSADEIATLFASMNVDSPDDNTDIATDNAGIETDISTETNNIDTSNDSNKKLSPEEIEALFASVR